MKTEKELKEIMFKKCYIIPFEINGTIVAIWLSDAGTQYKVRYYINSKQEENYFYPSEIEIK